MKKTYDVIIVGGGPAGLSAGLALARGRREVLIFDNQKPRNAPAKHMQNFPAHDGTPPGDFKEMIIKDLKKYPNIHFENVKVDEIEKHAEGFRIKANGHVYNGRKIMLAHGMVDEMLPIEGFKELWGKAIFQCPYCHGYEIQNSPIAFIGESKIAKHMLPLLKGLTDDLVLFTNGEAIEDREEIEKKGIKIFTDKIVGLDFEGENLKGVKLLNGEYVQRSYLFIKVPQKFSTDIATKLGCSVNEMGFYEVDEMGKTSVDGIYAAGDIVTMRQSVLNACSSGQLAGTVINYELLSEDF